MTEMSSVLMRLSDSSARVEEAISGIRRDVDSLRRDVSEEKNSAHESRRDINDKIDEMAARTSQLENAVKIDAAITAQTRDILDKKVMPVVAEFTALKWQGVGMLTAVAVAGGALTFVLTLFGPAILAKFGVKF